MQPTPLNPVKRKRGRPAGLKDKVPRKRRSKSEIVAAAKVVRPIRESDIQKQFIKWLDTVPAPGLPGCKLGTFVYAVPNGIWIPAPLQQRIQIIMAQRRLGLKKGIPDVIIDYPLHDWHGCRLELKRDASSEIHDEQKAWCEALRGRGYFVELCAGLAAATGAVGRYLRGEPPLAFPWAEDAEHVHRETG
jgi:hypothetical protein